MEQSAEPDAPVNAAAVSDLLYETLKLLERGKLETAFVKCRQALRANPNSTSGHSLLGLVYEKKADQEAERGNVPDAEDYLHAAIRQVERVLESNPHSVADREKLEELNARLADMSDYFAVKHWPVLSRMWIQETLRRVPLPWAISTAVFFVVLFLVLVFSGSNPGRHSRRETRQARAELPAQPSQFAEQPTGQPGAVQTQPQPASPVWTYQPTAPAGTALPPKVYTEPLPQNYRSTPVGVSPRSLPSLQPYPVEPPKPVTPLPAPGKQQPAGQAPPPPERPASERARTAFSSGDYDSAANLYQDAIAKGEDTPENQQSLGMALYNQDKKSSAISHFERAVQLFMDRKAKGVDVSGADSGIRTCKMYIELSKE